jgi:hypothetical protein
MKKSQTCPRCGRELSIAFRPTNAFFQRIGLENGIFCRSCNARVRLRVTSSYLALIFYLPYFAVLSWNIFVAQYGMKHYGFGKLDEYWVVLSIGILAVGIFVQSRNKAYVLHDNPSNKAN